MEGRDSEPMTTSQKSRSKASRTVSSYYRAVYHVFGFQKGYNFPFYLITVGALFGFVLARFEYLSFNGIYMKKAIPGEQYWYRSGHRSIGIKLHLACVLFGGLLATFQFTPIIRHKFRWFHRVCGYLAISLLILGNVGAFMILDNAVGGKPVTQVYFGVLGFAVTCGLLVAYINIKRLQIDQHRAWMIRSWSWAASIITLRLILGMAISVITTYGYVVTSQARCDEIFFMYQFIAGIPDQANPTARLYPACGAQAATSTKQVTITSSGKGPETGAALVRSVFTMSGWLATTVHIFLTELYLWLTPAESYRLRKVSYEMQVAKGLRQKGHHMDAGIGSTRFGDSPEWWSLPGVDSDLLQQTNNQHQITTVQLSSDVKAHLKPDSERLRYQNAQESKERSLGAINHDMQAEQPPERKISERSDITLSERK